VSSLFNLNSTRLDCSFIVASDTLPDCMSFLNIVKDLLSGEFTVELYCCTPKNIKRPSPT